MPSASFAPSTQLPAATALPMATAMGEPIVVQGEPIMGVPVGGQAPLHVAQAQVVGIIRS